MEKNQNLTKLALCKKVQHNLYQIVGTIGPTEGYDIWYIAAPLTKASAAKVERYLKLGKVLLITGFNVLTQLEPYDIVVYDSLPEPKMQDTIDGADAGPGRLEYAKQNVLLEAERFFDQKINTVTNLTYYEFIVLNNNLMEQGYFITDTNKEEKYIEILETENDDLIDILEKYLMNKDEIARSFAAYETYRTLKLNIADTEDLEEVNKLYQAFKKDWISKAGYVRLD